MLQWPNDLRYAQSCSVQVPCSLAYSVAQSSAHDMARGGRSVVVQVGRAVLADIGVITGGVNASSGSRL